MPSITSQPGTTALNAAYGSSLTYTVTNAYSPGDAPPAIEARITINSVLFSTQYYQPTSISGSTATFSININGIVQEWFESLNAYPGSFTGYVNYTSALMLANIQVQFFAWEPNVDGLLELTGGPATSATSKAINSAQSSLSAFYSTSGRNFLTNKPNNTILQSSEGELLAVYTTVPSEVVVKTYNSLGLQGTYTKTLSGSGARIVVMGVGLPNLLAMQLDGWTSQATAGGDMMDGGVTIYYTIQVKNSGGAAFTDLRTFYLDTSDDCLSYRIYFLNRLGFYDGVSLYGNTYDFFGTRSLLFESPVSETQYGLVNKVYSRLDNGFRAEFLGLTDAEMTWLKELAGTIDAYETTAANPIVVEDVTGAVEKDTFAAIPELTLNFIYSNYERSQRN